MLNSVDCLVCGKKLKYYGESTTMICHYCKKNFESNTCCEDGHYVCDSCHGMDAYEIIKSYCKSCESNNPIEMAEVLIRHPSIKMHGPEHHFLVPAVLLTAYANSTNQKEKLPFMIKECEKRARNVLGGFCGFYGTCGAAVGTGIFMSIVLGATPMSQDKWGKCNLMTARSLESISSFGGPRCCKRDSFLAIEEAVKFLEENMEIKLKSRNYKCKLSCKNSECLQEKCKFHVEYY